MFARKKNDFGYKQFQSKKWINNFFLIKRSWHIILSQQLLNIKYSSRIFCLVSQLISNWPWTCVNCCAIRLSEYVNLYCLISQELGLFWTLELPLWTWMQLIYVSFSSKHYFLEYLILVTVWCPDGWV